MDNSNGFNQPIPGPAPEPTPQPVPPVQPAQPAPEPVPQPIQPEQPAQPVQPVQPMQPVQPVQPVQPMQPNPMQHMQLNPMQPIATPAAAPKPQMDPAKKRNIIIGSCIGGGCLILGIIAIILVVVLGGKPDYQSSYDKMGELAQTINTFSTGNCANIVRSLTGSSYANNEPETYIEPCKKDVAEIYTKTNELGETSGVKKDSEVKKAYDEFKNTLQESIPEGDDLEKELKAIQDLGNFAAKFNAINISSSNIEATRSTVTEALSYLTNSENEKIAEMGRDLSTRFNDLFDSINRYKSAAEAYQNANVFDANYSELYQAYSDALSEMSSKSSNLSSTSIVDMLEGIGFKLKNANGVVDKFDDLRDSIREKLTD